MAYLANDIVELLRRKLILVIAFVSKELEAGAKNALD
jgi:hypothetical protein